MRGFVFIGGEGPDPGVDIGLAGADVLVAADSGLSALASRGLRADYVVGDMDSLQDLDLLSDYPPDRIRRYPSEKDDTDTEIALALLSELGCGERAIVGGGGGRLDHILAIAALFERPSAPDRWVTRAEDIACLDAVRCGQRLVAEAEAGATVSFFPVGQGPWSAESVGLKWPLDVVSWTRGSIGISNIAVSSSFSVSVASGRFLAVMPLGLRWSVSSAQLLGRTPS